MTSMLSVPFWLWVIWGVSLVWEVFSRGGRGFTSTLIGFFVYLILRHFMPGLGTWEQYGAYVVICLLLAVAFVINGPRTR